MHKKITPEDVGRYLGIGAANVRRMMESGALPIGVVIADGERKSYVIYPKRLSEATGMLVEGFEPPRPEVDYMKLAGALSRNLDYPSLCVGLAEEFSRRNKERINK